MHACYMTFFIGSFHGDVRCSIEIQKEAYMDGVRRMGDNRDGIHKAWLMNRFEHTATPDPTWHTRQKYWYCVIWSGMSTCSNMFVNHASCIPSLSFLSFFIIPIIKLAGF